MLPEQNHFPEEAFRQSVQNFPPATQGSGIVNIFTHTFGNVFAQINNRIVPWGAAPIFRDKQLSEFWPTEPFLAGAVANVCERNAALEFEVEGPPRTAQAVTDMLNSAIAGTNFGWIPFVMGLSANFYTQDQGFFMELIRDPGIDVASRFKDDKAPVLGIANLDASLCFRTGNPRFPVLYTDEQTGKEKKLKWWQVIAMSEFPSPIKRMYGVGYSAVTRVLRYAQIMQSIEKFKDEKVSGRHFKALHLVSGPSKTEIKQGMRRSQEEADNEGNTKFILPAIIASLDPTKPVSHVEIPLASLPDNFDFDVEMRWYISCLALGFAVDYQEFAPLPGGNIGSSSQSEILHKKSRGKSQSVFMRMFENVLRDYGVIPRNVTFNFLAKDIEEDIEAQALRTSALEEIAISVRNGMLTPQAAREMMVNRGLWEASDIANIPDDFGLEVIMGRGNEQLLGTTGDTTMSEDISRQNKEDSSKEGVIKRIKNKILKTGKA